jgi:hypothetical protein
MRVKVFDQQKLLSSDEVSVSVLLLPRPTDFGEKKWLKSASFHLSIRRLVRCELVDMLQRPLSVASTILRTARSVSYSIG